MKVRWLGRIPYEEALSTQEQLAEQRRNGTIGDTLLLLEHEPVYTIGRSSDRSSLETGITLPHPIIEISRGGKATYHGPGQLVGYAILDLKNYGKDLHTYLRALEKSLIALCQDLGITAARREGRTGVWVEDRKLASIGIGVRQWISMHGIALNVCGQLTGFDAIIPCGIQDVAMTSIERELPQQPWSVEEVGARWAPFLHSELKKLRQICDDSSKDTLA